MMMKVWKWYQSCLSHRPLKTQVISSCVIWRVNNMAHQYNAHRYVRLTHDKAEDFKVNWKQVVMTSTIGFGFGLVGHFWFKKLDKYTKFNLRLSPNSARFVAAKVVIDGLFFEPLYYLITCKSSTEKGKSVEQVKEEYKRVFMKRKLMGGSHSGLGLIAQIVNFRYVPVRYQLLYVNIFCLLDATIIPWAYNKRILLKANKVRVD